MPEETENNDEMSDSNSHSSSDPDEPKGKLRKWWDAVKQKVQDNPYEDIRPETGLLVDVKDILDELNILRTLVQDQQHVYNLWKGTKHDSKANHFPHMTERQEDLRSMVDDVTSIQDAIKSLLDLKQKEATIIEAQTTRRQSDSVMVFTVVTIVFVSLTLSPSSLLI
ncbi:uncharacterized protein N7483_007221 [Penicillium malachiteum]|uniref:uncharacterized protein n=1 Tax=Penicillium malachiteum TaxID=1324776 RepID=UPI002547615D|nr:uncharacterized protein N7483_007221 [Penicillium malachiteum]KAJ5725864.1 hypothetical protein N7483_007221 [Penicillium malachiteum]